jgi:hypothetical protein
MAQIPTQSDESDEVRQRKGALKGKEKRRINNLKIIAFDSIDEAMLDRIFRQVKVFFGVLIIYCKDRSGSDRCPYRGR